MYKKKEIEANSASQERPLFSRKSLFLHKARSRVTEGLKKAPYLAKDLEEALIRRLDIMGGKVSLDSQKNSPPPQAPLKVLVIGCLEGTLRAFLEARSSFFHISFWDPFDSFAPEREISPPTAEGGYDLILEGLVFHWLNDPLLYLRRLQERLCPGGLYMASFLGGKTLTEVRQAFIETDLSLFSGAFARVSPMIPPEAATRLLQATGFVNPVIDHEETQVNYPRLKVLLKDLQAMGESNALTSSRENPMPKSYLTHAEEYYHKLFGKKIGTSQQPFEITFDFVFMMGWRSTKELGTRIT